MREIKGTGGGTNIVSTLVAVLEQQLINNNIQMHNSSDVHSCGMRKTLSPLLLTPTKAPAKNNCYNQAADENFQSAVNDFNSVVQHVEKKSTRTKQDDDESKNGLSYSQDNVIPANTTTKYLRSEVDVGFNGKRVTKVNGNSVSTPTVLTSNNTHHLAGIECTFSDQEYDDDDGENEEDTTSSSCDSEGGPIDDDGLTTIAEEDSISHSHNNSSIFYKGLEEDDDVENTTDNAEDNSSLEDDTTTLKDKPIGWFSTEKESISDTSTSSCSERLQTLKDSSTRCNEDFEWFCKKELKMNGDVQKCQTNENHHTRLKSTTRHEKHNHNNNNNNSGGGSLDRRRKPSSAHHYSNGDNGFAARHERDHRSRSTHISKSPPRLDDFVPCQNWCCNPHENCFNNFHRRHERFDPQRYGSSPMLMEPSPHSSAERGCSHSDIYVDGGVRHKRPEAIMGYCGYHVMPPCCCYFNNHWATTLHCKSGEVDDRNRKLQYEKDNLQLQVQVLSEQIEAQNDKINELERTLGDKKQLIADTEDKLQREILSRSSLETQKLELMSIMSELKLQQASLERENHDLRTAHYNNNIDVKKPPLGPRMVSPSGQFSSTPVHQQILRMSPSPSPVASSINNSRKSETSDTSSKTPPATHKRQIDIHYGSLPRQQFFTNGTILCSSEINSSGGTTKKGVVFGRGLTTLIGGRTKGYSVPNLVECNEKDEVANRELTTTDGPPQQDHAVQFNKSKGIKKIFGRMKRSGSGNLDELPGIDHFQRGGVRATAAARLGWSEPHLITKPDKPFSHWDIENICDWLQDLGLDQYITDMKRWLRNGTGQQLLESPIAEIEHELNIKNALHKKKLQLALLDAQENGTSDVFLNQAGRLDTTWVLRWLDDIGLPQHKENFLIHRVDGRVLHRLTVDDLALLHVTSLLHVASIKRGIQVLRENGYEPTCLQRRSTPDDESNPTPKQISLWSSHRVMEWLRSVDLSEYAPNLRGVGIHGGLMVYEVKFTAELMATLLSIPQSKTLLRRHLNIRFKELLGKDIIQDKRTAETTLGYVPLTSSSKLKVNKKSQFSLKRKKSKGESDFGDLVCPLNADNLSGEQNGSPLIDSKGMTKKKQEKDEDAYQFDEIHCTKFQS